MRLLVMRQDLVPSGSESTSAGHVDISYRRGNCKNFGPLGIRNGGIKESQLSVSSQFQTHHYKAGNGPYLSGLHSLKEYWAPAAGLPSYDRRQYVQVDFRSLKDIKMISAQGHPEAKAPIKSLQIRVSNDGYRWKDYSGTNVKMPLTTRWLRISPRFSDGLIGFRFEVFGCSSEKPFFSFEDPPLGMESGQITDNQTSSSSYFDDYTTATKARLNLQELTGGWCAQSNEYSEWLAVDLVTSHVISAVSSQCRFPKYKNGKGLFCAASYRLSYLDSDRKSRPFYMENGIAKVFLGNLQRHAMVKHHLIKPIQSRKIIFNSISTKNKEYICMRVELYGRKTVQLQKGVDRPVVYSRAFLVDTQFNRLFVCNTEKSRTKSHCYVTLDGKTWIALNHKLLTIHGLDKAGKLHGVYLNEKAFLSCEQHGEGACNAGTAENWCRARDEPGIITAIEVPNIAETGLDTTDLPSLPLRRTDGIGRFWGGNYLIHKNG
ncbi:hypothetical protein OS493_025357 [Desmophyllum pertusum]|uniref:F5/8 type C domain-containing protein n=1 Tax=Desmophyllum pertusum TaxID=174260 RepID=A0A9X0CRE2_9CNID|nr:hypothetical protein OS493_025357 [Desmophyllum pertusum]